jgi:hypothetical protein
MNLARKMNRSPIREIHNLMILRLQMLRVCFQGWLQVPVVASGSFLSATFSEVARMTLEAGPGMSKDMHDTAVFDHECVAKSIREGLKLESFKIYEQSMKCRIIAYLNVLWVDEHLFSYLGFCHLWR